MRTNVSFVLLALPIFMVQSIAVAQQNTGCSSKSFVDADYELIGVGMTKVEASMDFERWFPGFKDKIFKDFCEPACAPDCKASLVVSPQGKRRSSMKLLNSIPEWEVAQDMTAICTCSELEKNISEAGMDFVR
jgi:hypothetical protein